MLLTVSTKHWLPVPPSELRGSACLLDGGAASSQCEVELGSNFS
jgi:hypothetical protein